MPILNPIIIRLLIWFIWRQLVKYGKDVNWEWVKADFSKRIRKIIPGDEFDDAAEFLFCLLIDMVVVVINSGEMPMTKRDLRHTVVTAQNELVGDAICQYVAVLKKQVP